MDNTTDLLKACISHEENKKRKLELARNIADISSSHLDAMLTVFEQKFESDEGEFNYEQMASYHLAAKFMEKWKERKHIADRVWARMKELPY